MRRIGKIAAMLLVCALTATLSGCQSRLQKYSTTFYGTFDSYGTITGYCRDESAFQAVAGETVALLRRLHALFDGYTEYEGLVSLYTLNKTAANGPVAVSEELFDILFWCKNEAPQYSERVNIAMGAVLSLWHDSREAALADPENASLPDPTALSEAAKHCDMDDLILDAENRTVYFADPLLKLDLGAIAKGWAADVAAETLRNSEMPSFLLNLGGNVIAGEKPGDGREAWNVSVMNPDGADETGSDRLALLRVTGLSVVTSGDYQRFFTLEGIRYHHVIDPDTLAPSKYLRAATVTAGSSAQADLLSTTLLLLPYEKGRELIDSIEGAEALWVMNDGSVRMTDGMTILLAGDAA